jgi:hypothetical protein
MSLYCSGDRRAHGEGFRRPPLIYGRQMQMNRNGAGTHVTEHFVDGLADHSRFAVASGAGGAIGNIQIGFRC